MKRLLLLSILTLTAIADESRLYKAVFDCASGNMKFVESRIKLIEKSAEELTSKAIPFSFVLTIHSRCTPIIDKQSGETVIERIQSRMKLLHQLYGVKIEACEIAVDAFGYGKSDMPPYIETVENSITRVIELQNNGYAFFPYH